MPTSALTRAITWRPPGSLRLPDEVWDTRHRWVTTVLLMHLPLLAAWSWWRDAPPSSDVLLALPAGLYLIAAVHRLTGGRIRIPRTLAACAAATGLMACSSYLVDVSGGYIEAHFHFFVMVPVVALYEAWEPFSLAVLWVLVEHGVVGTVWPHAVYGMSMDHAMHPWTFALVHAGFFAAAAVGSLIALTLAERARGEQLELVRELRHQALHDDLTGLMNRNGLAQSLQTALTHGEPVALLSLDLDRFKEVNDTLGHTAGDQLLREVGARAAATVGAAGVVVRLGGDEFAALLPRADEQQALRMALRLRSAIEGPTTLLGVQVVVGVSVGIAARSARRVDAATDHRRCQRETAEQLLREADVAMDSAKRAGTGTAVYDPTLDDHSAARLALLNDFKRALDVDDQIVVHLQPKVAVVTGDLVGVEALARWQHPTRGLLPPSEFIAMANSPELSPTFTGKVLDLALDQCGQWLREGYAVRVAVNITPFSLLCPNFSAEVARLLDHHQVPPALLCLELTEDALITDPEGAAAVLTSIRTTGVRCSIDDFGTGFSSLSYLRRLPIDEIKIDRSFVVALFPQGPTGPVDDVLVGSIIELGHRLGVQVVAEGVEHEHELAVMRRLGCDSVQGYLHSPPVPADRFPQPLLHRACPGMREATHELSVPARS